MSVQITRYRMAANPPDLLLHAPYDACRTLDFHHAARMIEMGRELMSTALDEHGLKPEPLVLAPAAQ